MVLECGSPPCPAEAVQAKVDAALEVVPGAERQRAGALRDASRLTIEARNQGESDQIKPVVKRPVLQVVENQGASKSGQAQSRLVKAFRK
jgi:hypothetical protein